MYLKKEFKMGVYVISASILLYTLMSISNFKDKDYPHTMIWICYALANVGFLWHELIKAGYFDK